MSDPAPKTWRQGDVFLIAIPSIPSGRRESHELVLARGEITGHSHRIKDPSVASACRVGGSLFLEVTGAKATLEHEEHGPIDLPRGTYEVRIQREYVPGAIPKRVVD